MTNVPIAEFKDNASAWISAAEAGEEIILTRHGKPAAKLVAAIDDAARAAVAENKRMTRQREAVAALFELGREHRSKYGSVSIDEIIEWKNEGRR